MNTNYIDLIWIGCNFFLKMFKQVFKNFDLGVDVERVRKEEQGKIDEVEVLIEEELVEKEDFLKEVSQIQN